MAKKSLLGEFAELRRVALAVFQAGQGTTKQQWEELRKALNLPEGTVRGDGDAILVTDIGTRNVGVHR